MKALSEPNRIKIIKILQHKHMCVCELQHALGISQPTVSKHLKLLKEAQLVFFTKDGLWVDYHLNGGSYNPYAACLLGNLRHWLKDDNKITELTDKLPSIHRKAIRKK